jgi:DNA-binding transcriptional LysR family regulator
MTSSKMNLKALEVFLTVSRRGTLQEAARDLGISISTASHHLSELEKSIGTPLFDHSSRPMSLTPAGEVMRIRAEEALASLRKGLSEIWSDDAHSLVRPLRLAMIEDFDADVAPALTKDLLDGFPHCELSLLSRPTHGILDLLRRKKIDLGVSATADFDGSGLTETPLLRDPFILLLPAGMAPAPATLSDLAAMTPDLPLLRYDKGQLLGQRIEAQLRRLNSRFAHRMSFETTHVILSLVAAGRGWTVTTALSFARGPRLAARPCRPKP